MDITETLAPRSDQQNFDDYLAGPRTVTVTAGRVTGNAEQPVAIELAEYPGRPYKPNKSMRRVIAAAWGVETDAYVGRRMTLVGNPDVKYGGKAVGGIEIAAMSHIEKPLTLPLTETRGRKRQFTVEPLKDAPAPKPARDWVTEARQFTTVDDIRAHWVEAKAGGATDQQLADIQALATQPAQEEQQ